MSVLLKREHRVLIQLQITLPAVEVISLPCWRALSIVLASTFNMRGYGMCHSPPDAGVSQNQFIFKVWPRKLCAAAFTVSLSQRHGLEGVRLLGGKMCSTRLSTRATAADTAGAPRYILSDTRAQTCRKCKTDVWEGENIFHCLKRWLTTRRHTSRYQIGQR